MRKIERYQARSLYRRQLFWTVQNHVSVHNGNEAWNNKSIDEVKTSICDFGAGSYWIPYYAISKQKGLAS